MRKLGLLLSLTLLACGDDATPEPADALDGGRDAGSQDASVRDLDAGLDLDAGKRDGAASDASLALPEDAAVLADAAPAPADATADAAVCPTVLLAGGADVVAQGWSTVMQAPSTLGYGADHVRLETSTAAGGRTSGQLLLTYPNALPTDAPFKVQIVLQVESVNAHNALDSAAAILGAFTPPFGNGMDRAKMVYLDSASIGWADDMQSAAVPVVDGAYHTYELSVDAQRVARVARDGVELLTRTGFTTNGTLAIGDQTNDPMVDAVIRIRSVTRSCL